LASSSETKESASEEELLVISLLESSWEPSFEALESEEGVN